MPRELFQLQTSFDNLLDWREAQRLSQAEAAEVLEISQSLYSKLERGRHFVKGSLAKRLVEKTGVPLAVVVGAA